MMWWRLFQSLVIFAVIASNIRWQWTPNGYIPALFGGLLAYFLTFFIVSACDRWFGEDHRAQRLDRIGRQ